MTRQDVIEILGRRAKPVTYITGAILGIAAVVVLFEKLFVVPPATQAATAAVSEVVRREGQLTRDSLRAEQRAEMTVKFTTDSLVLVQLGALSEIIAYGAFTKRQVLDMRAASYARQDSLVRVLRTEFGKHR